MAFDTLTSWQIEEGKVEAETDFIFLGSKLTEVGDSLSSVQSLSYV